MWPKPRVVSPNVTDSVKNDTTQRLTVERLSDKLVWNEKQPPPVRRCTDGPEPRWPLLAVSKPIADFLNKVVHG